MKSFSHNDFYHRFLLRPVPPGCGRALDVGCGTGLFARRLAGRARAVEGVDRAPEVIAAARARSLDVPNVDYACVDLADHDLANGCYDYISCIASIHHLPFAETVTRLREALAPGGVLAIVGCYRQVTPADYARDVIAIPSNLVANAVLGAIARLRGPVVHIPVPVAQPRTTLDEIKHDSARLLPGAVIRRRVYWRYSLVYRKNV